MHRKSRLIVASICLFLTPTAAAWVGTHFSYNSHTPRTEIYRGVFYRSYMTAHGLVHLVEVDLTRPGVDLYVTPLDPEAMAQGYQYRLDYVRNAARDEGLAVAVNGMMFGSDSYLIPMVGDFATSVDSSISNFRISHLHPRDYMLWFDEQLTPYLETSRPAPLEVLQRAKWAVGSQGLIAPGDEPRGDSPRDKLTALGIDLDKRRLWIGVFESATHNEGTKILMESGARHVMLLDGGDSTSLYLGGRTRGTSGGLRFGGQRPVATVIGIRADAILDPL